MTFSLEYIPPMLESTRSLQTPKRLQVIGSVKLNVSRTLIAHCKTIPLWYVKVYSTYVLGGEYVRNDRRTGEYNRNVFILAKGMAYQCHNQLKECYPPMKTASASPAAVSYKNHIVVVHKSGPMEVLNTNSPSPAWVEVRPAPYFPTTPSATLLGDLLVIWSGTLYCTDLRDVFTDDTEDSNPTADWTTLPSPPITSSLACLTTLNEQLIAISAKNTDGRRPLYAFNSATGKWSNITNQCPGDVTVCLDSKTLLTFCNADGLQLCVANSVRTPHAVVVVYIILL